MISVQKGDRMDIGVGRKGFEPCRVCFSRSEIPLRVLVDSYP
jgi:hypothetical protein